MTATRSLFVFKLSLIPHNIYSSFLFFDAQHKCFSLSIFELNDKKCGKLKNLKINVISKHIKRENYL